MSEKSNNVFTVFLVIRLVRIVKLINSWTSLKNLLKTISITLKDIRNLAILLFIFTFVSALVGMQLFGYKVRLNSRFQCALQDENAKPPIRNFDNFFISLLSIFTLLTGDDWHLTVP